MFNRIWQLRKRALDRPRSQSRPLLEPLESRALLSGEAVTPPPNDNFADRIVLTGVTASSTVDNTGATYESGEIRGPDINWNIIPGGKDVWWQWTCPVSGHFAIMAGDPGGKDTHTSIFTGSSLTALTGVGGGYTEDWYIQGEPYHGVDFNARAGTTYQIEVETYQAGLTGLHIEPWQWYDDNHHPALVGWQTQQIGGGPHSGADGFDQSPYFYDGGGVIGKTADSNSFAYQKLTGNGTLVARLGWLTNTSAVAGLEVRSNLSAKGAFAGMLIGGNKRTSGFYYRPKAGAKLKKVSTKAAVGAWIKIQKRGSVIITWTSTDGKRWARAGSVNLGCKGPMYIGFATASQKAGTNVQAYYDGFAFAKG